MLSLDQSFVSKLTAVFLMLWISASGQESRWGRIRHYPLPVWSKANWEASHSWDNELTINAEQITLHKTDGTTLTIATHSVSKLAYGREALFLSNSDDNGVIILYPIAVPVILIGALKQKIHPSNHHFIAIEQPRPRGERFDILLEADGSNYSEILLKLTGTTGLPLRISIKDKRWMPKGITARIRDKKGTHLSQPTVIK